LADLIEGYGVQGFTLGEIYRQTKSVTEKRKLIYDFLDSTQLSTEKVEPLDANDIP
jgi:hypothetical protein